MALTGEKFIKHPRDIYIGWWMALTAGLLCLWGKGFYVYGFSALFKPISGELGFSRTATSFAASLTRLEGGLEAPLIGWISDRYGPKVMTFIGVCLAGVGMICMYWINSLWAFYIVWAVICSHGINIGLGMPLDVALANWFIKKRGTASSIKWVLSGLSGTLGLPFVSWLIIAFGWRMACVIGGSVLLVFGLPLVLLFIKSHRPEYYGLLPDGDPPEIEEIDIDPSDNREKEEVGIETRDIELTPKQAIRTHSFWLIILSYSFHGALYPVLMIHCVPFLTDRGMDPLVAAATMSVYVTASIPARFLGGIIVDRVGISQIRFLLSGAFIMQCVAVTLFLFNQQSMVALYTFLTLYGIGFGAILPMTPVMRARYFGRKNFGVIAGISRIFNMPVGIMGPIAAGWIYDYFGSYILAFTLLAILLGISSVTMMFATPPR